MIVVAVDVCQETVRTIKLGLDGIYNQRPGLISRGLCERTEELVSVR